VVRAHRRRVRAVGADAGGTLHSRTFPGLRLAAKSLLDGDFATVLSALSEGIDTPEHAAFAAKLRTAGLSLIDWINPSNRSSSTHSCSS